MSIFTHESPLASQVRLATSRNDDMAIFGGRPALGCEYRVGFDGEGRILALDLRCTLQVCVRV